MGTNFLQPLSSKSSPPTPLIFTKPFVKHLQISLHCHQRSLRVSPINSTNTSSDDNNTANGDGAQPAVPRPVTPPNTVEIKYRRRSRRQSRRQREDGVGNGQLTKAQPRASASDPPKKWEDMSFAEKAIELYVGEKGMLFWLNKFAYASIFIVIGGWILFRFVGPSLNLYQLDSAPLAPTSIFKGP